MSSRFWATSFLPAFTSTFRVGSPCWAWRASSVWIDEISAPKSRSPTFIVSAAIPRNCRLVKPVSKVNVSWIAVETASFAVNMSSKT